MRKKPVRSTRSMYAVIVLCQKHPDLTFWTELDRTTSPIHYSCGDSILQPHDHMANS